MSTSAREKFIINAVKADFAASVYVASESHLSYIILLDFLPKQ